MLALSSSCSYFPMERERGEGRGGYKVGKPYKISGVWYYPSEDYQYDQIGIASWYGEDFHGKRTANGELYNMDAITAAHKTLPMPSIVQVTNLANGRTLILRVNDRGPFVSNRIIDVSRRSAQLLGFKDKGVAKVRVRILAEESMQLAAQLKDGKTYMAKKVGVNIVKEEELRLNDERVSKKAGQDSKTAKMARDAPLAPGNRLFIQVGAFLEEKNADQLITSLKGSGFAVARKFKQAGDRLTRVRLGPFGQMAEAKKRLSEVIKKGYDSSRLVVISP